MSSSTAEADAVAEDEAGISDIFCLFLFSPNGSSGNRNQSSDPDAEPCADVCGSDAGVEDALGCLLCPRPVPRPVPFPCCDRGESILYDCPDLVPAKCSID